MFAHDVTDSNVQLNGFLSPWKVLMMQITIRMFSVLIFLVSVIWLAISPALQPLLACSVSMFMLLATFVKFDLNVKKILTGFGLLGSTLWVIVSYQSVEPYVALFSATLAYISVNSDKIVRGVMLSRDGANMDNRNASEKPRRLEQEYRELKQQWEGLTERIQALTNDLIIEMDSERKHTLQRRLVKLKEEREQIESLIRNLENKME